MMNLPRTLIAASFLENIGVSVLRMKPNRDKRPDGEWKEFQSRRATQDEIRDLFADGAPLGVVTGAVSGNLVMAEVEGRAAFQVAKLRDLAHDSGLGELWDKVDQGWKEISPSTGIHWFFRTESAPAGNRKLARRPSTEAEWVEWVKRETLAAEDIPDAAKRAVRLQKIANTTQNDIVQVLAETRGEGGFVVVAPTPGHFHTSGNPWRMARGCSPDRVPTLTDDEADAFLGILSTLDVPIPGKEHGEPKPAAARRPDTAGRFGGVSPGDDYERTPWEEILIPHGWRLAFEGSDGVKYWTRPGKTFGVSASTGRDPERDRLYVFTTSTSFDSEVPYTKFGAYAHLVHDNDYKAAASQLRKEGYGRDPEITAVTPPRLTAAPPLDLSHTRQDREESAAQAPPVAPGVGSSSNLATVTELKPAKTPVALTRTEAGNATLFINRYGSIVRYVSGSKSWFCWENTRWVKQHDGGTAAWHVRQLVADLPADTEEDRKWKAKSSTAHMMTAVLKLAAKDPRVLAEPTDFDSVAWELNTPAGPVDLKTGKMLAPDPGKMHSKQTVCAPDFEADQGPWLKFLADTFPGKPEMIEYLQRLAGLTLVGEVREHLIIFGQGGGGNGKGVAYETMGRILGDYATVAAEDFLMKKQFKDHPEEIARLYGMRMFVIPEVDKDAKFDEARANRLSGGDNLSGRFMGENTFDFAPSHQIWLSGNHLPKVTGGGAPGFWRRLRMVPFAHTVPDDQVDVSLGSRLRHAHGPAILAWMIQGAVKYAQDGLVSVEPAEVKQATRAYRNSMDTLGLFISEECEYVAPAERERLERDDPYYTIPRAPIQQFYNRYAQWCKDNGDRPMAKREMSATLRDRFQISAGKVRNAAKQRQYEWVTFLDRSLTLGEMDDAPTPE